MRPRNDSGFSLVVLVAAITVMLILMGAAVPTWRYIMKNDREEELYFRGDQIARAIERYQRKNGNALPVSMEALVKVDLALLLSAPRLAGTHTANPATIPAGTFTFITE